MAAARRDDGENVRVGGEARKRHRAQADHRVVLGVDAEERRGHRLDLGGARVVVRVGVGVAVERAEERLLDLAQRAREEEGAPVDLLGDVLARLAVVRPPGEPEQLERLRGERVDGAAREAALEDGDRRQRIERRRSS